MRGRGRSCPLLACLLLSAGLRGGTGDAGPRSEAVAESYLTILYPFPRSCFTTAEGVLLAVALSSHTWEHHPQNKNATIFINGAKVGTLELYPYEANHNNVHMDLAWMPEGVHTVRVELTNALAPGEDSPLKIAEQSLDIRIGADNCPYACHEVSGGSGHCPHPAPPRPVLEAQLDTLAAAKFQVLQPLAQFPVPSHGDVRVPGCNLALNKPAMQSSVDQDGAGGGGAEYGVDGLTAVGSFQDSRGDPFFSLTKPEVAPWWMVDLEADVQIYGVSVWLQVQLGNADDYPAALPDWSSRGSLAVTVYNHKGHVTFQDTVEAPKDPASRHALFFETGVVGEPVVGRFVRVMKKAEAGNGTVLGLREVKVEGRACWDCHRHCIHGECRAIPESEGVSAMRASWQVCVCEADWLGHDCSTNLLADLDFLPPVWEIGGNADNSRPVVGGEADESEDVGVAGLSDDFRSATAELRAALHPSNCSRVDAQVNFFPNAGFASVLHFMAGLTNLALAHGRTFVTSPVRPWVYSLDHPDCWHKGAFSCYLQPWSSCQGRAPSEAEGGAAAAPDGVAAREAAFYVPETLINHFYFVPAKYRARGIFWWRMVQMQYLLRLNQRTKQEVDLASARRDIGYSKPIIGLHVRRGDSCHTTLRRNKCVPLTRHLEAVLVMSARYNISKVFVATDDTSALEHLRAQAPDLDFISLPSYDRSNLQSGDNVWLENRLLQGDLSGHQLLLFTLRDLALLSEADVFVGHFASNLSRLAFLKATFLQGSPPPFISVDGPWCPHWRMCCKLSASFPHSQVC